MLKVGTIDSRENNSDTSADKSDSNLDERIAKFHILIGTNYVYRIPLRYLIDLGLVKFLIKFNTKFNFYFETNVGTECTNYPTRCKNNFSQHTVYSAWRS